MADGHLTFDTKVDAGGFGAGMDKIKSMADSALGVFTGNMMTRAVDGLKALGQAALDSVSSLEQNIGGVQTLFKDSADTVIKNADSAYKTAGMSANTYMETVTGFAASLLQSLGGNTQKAAAVSDMAITDMSDNANKMGTSMQAIQYAYQGFAKQNYTMLDNLKLGYGGTKEEMQRLLADAQKITGVKYDISNLNDVYTAIHVIQEQLGITGTTAKEAATTIEGSMNAAKAAWDNFMNGSGDAQQLADAFGTAADNIVNALAEIIPRLANTMPTLITTIATRIPELVSELVPAVISAAKSLFSQVEAAVTSFDYAGFAAKIADVISGFIKSDAVGQFLDAAGAIIMGLARGLISSLPELIPAVVNLIRYIVQTIIDHVPDILDAGQQLMLALADALADTSPLLKPVADGLQAIADHLDVIGPAVAGAVAAFAAFKTAMAISTLINGARQALAAFKAAQDASTLAQAALNAVMNMNPFVLLATVIAGVVVALITLWNTNEDFRKAVIGIWTAIKGFFTATIPDIVQGIISWFQQLPTRIGQIFTSVLNAIAAWGANVLSWIASNVPQMIENIGQFFAQLPNRIAYGLGYAIGTLISWGANVLSWIVSNVPTWIDQIQSFFAQLPEKIWTWLVNTLSRLAQWGAQMASSAGSAMSNFLGAVTLGMQQLPGRVWSFLAQAVSRVAQWDAQMAARGASAAASLVHAVVSGVQQLPGRMESIGRDVVSGIWNGISSGWRWLTDQVASLANSLVAGVKSALKIGSPSKVFRDEVGRWILPGIEVGVEKTVPATLRGMQASVGAIVSSLQASVGAMPGPVGLSGAVTFDYAAMGAAVGGAMSGAVGMMQFVFDGREVGRMVRKVT
jgi:phage-related protein